MAFTFSRLRIVAALLTYTSWLQLVRCESAAARAAAQSPSGKLNEYESLLESEQESDSAQASEQLLTHSAPVGVPSDVGANTFGRDDHSRIWMAPVDPLLAYRVALALKWAH
jgi:hypothetical protein